MILIPQPMFQLHDKTPQLSLPQSMGAPSYLDYITNIRTKNQVSQLGNVLFGEVEKRDGLIYNQLLQHFGNPIDRAYFSVNLVKANDTLKERDWMATLVRTAIKVVNYVIGIFGYTPYNTYEVKPLSTAQLKEIIGVTTPADLVKLVEMAIERCRGRINNEKRDSDDADQRDVLTAALNDINAIEVSFNRNPAKAQVAYEKLLELTQNTYTFKQMVFSGEFDIGNITFGGNADTSIVGGLGMGDDAQMNADDKFHSKLTHEQKGILTKLTDEGTTLYNEYNKFFPKHDEEFTLLGQFFVDKKKAIGFIAN